MSCTFGFKSARTITQLDNPRGVNNKESVLTRLGHLMLIAALLGATGSHWVVLQSVAWATMLADNAKTDTLETALAKTFDGKHPCALCKQIAKGRQSEKKSDQQTNLKRLEFCNQRAVFIISPSAQYFLLGEFHPAAPLRAHAPPVPPPRSLAG